MLEYLAVALIALGVLLLLKGLREEVDTKELFIYEEEKREIEEVKPERKVEAGGVVLIGPIPIVFGSSRMAVLALVLTIILMLLVFLLFYV